MDSAPLTPDLSSQDLAAPARGAPPNRTLAVAALGVGALLLLLSVCALLTFFAFPLLNAQEALAGNTAVLSIAAILLGYGGLLVLIGNGLARNRQAAPLHLPPPLFLALAYVLVLVIGQGVLALNFATAYLFPVWHVLASLFVPLIVLSFATRRLAAVSVRSMLAQFTWGGLVTVALALVLELIVGGVLVFLASLPIALLLGRERLDELLAALQAAPPDMTRITQIITQEPLALLIVVFAAILLVVILVPLLEELLKAAGPGLLTARRVRAHMTPTRSDVLLWGLAAGAGYAFTENMLNAQANLANDQGLLGLWAGTMLLRAGTSLMHMLATATVAVGWYELIVHKKPVRLLLLLLAATTAHALWNGAALLLAGVSAVTLLNQAFGTAAGLVGVCVLSLLALLVVGGLVWLRVLLQWAKPPSDRFHSTNASF